MKQRELCGKKAPWPLLIAFAFSISMFLTAFPAQAADDGFCPECAPIKRVCDTLEDQWMRLSNEENRTYELYIKARKIAEKSGNSADNAVSDAFEKDWINIAAKAESASKESARCREKYKDCREKCLSEKSRHIVVSCEPCKEIAKMLQEVLREQSILESNISYLKARLAEIMLGDPDAGESKEQFERRQELMKESIEDNKRALEHKTEKAKELNDKLSGCIKKHCPDQCPPPQPDPVTNIKVCPKSQTGNIVEETPFFCLSGNWVPGEPKITNTCEAVQCPPPQPAPLIKAKPCPKGQIGQIVETTRFFCLNGDWAPGEPVTVGICEEPVIERVIPKEGNNPFDPQNPLGGGLTTPRTPMPGCTTPQPQPLIKTSPCPTGQTGSVIEQTPFFCMGGDWVPGAANITNSCTTTLPLGCSGPQPVSESQTQPCPAGQTGTITQQRAYVCANGSWVPGTNWITVSNTCTTTQTGCATNYSGGNYVCGGTCGIASASLSVISGSNTMTATFGSNSNVPVNCSGATANPQSTNLIILGLPGHTCTFTGSSLTSFGINCHNNSGGTCSSTCSR